MNENSEQKQNFYKISHARKPNISEWMKQKGAMLAKGRILGIQFLELFKDNLFFDLADHANKMAYKLSENIERQTALCAKNEDRVIGGLLFSLKENILLFLAVNPEYRGLGAASALIKKMTEYFPENSDIWVTTYRKEDTKGKAARILYEKCGFIEDELTEEFGYPCQKYVLHI